MAFLLFGLMEFLRVSFMASWLDGLMASWIFRFMA
jgi:hypothetical protein